MKLRRLMTFLVLAVFFLIPQVSLAFPRALLMIRDFHNWLEVQYEYNGRESDSSGSTLSLTEHETSETYHFDMEYAVYNPRWVHGMLEVDLGLNQEWYDGTIDGSGSDTNIESDYRLDGIIMDRKKTPINFYAESQAANVDRRFARNYDLQTDNYGIALTLKNRHLPTHFRYLRNRSETSGLDLDRVLETSTISGDCSHQYLDVSLTEVSYTHTDDDTSYHGGNQPDESSTDEEFQARNTLSWGEHLKRSFLTSSYRTQNESGYNDLNSKDWSEFLLWKPGLALTMRLNYQVGDDESGSLSRHDKKMGAQVEHHLYESLVSRFRIHQRQTDYDTGQEDESGWLLGMSYHKKLPMKSLVNFDYSYHYQETDRDVDGNLFFVVDERLIIDLFSRNVLTHQDVVEDSIVVQNKDRTITYQLGADYLVEQLGRETEIVIPAGSPISAGDMISVDYQYVVEPSIEYSTIVHQAFASVSLFERRYRIYADMIISDQELLSRRDDPELNDRLYDLRSYTVGCEANHGTATYGLEYVDYDSSTDKRRYLEGFWRYHRYYPRQFFYLSCKDRVTRYEDSEYGGNDGGSENVLTVGLKYKRRLPLGALGEVTIDFLDHRGRQNDRDELDVELSYQLEVGKLVVEVSLEENFDWYEDQNAREDRVLLKIRRYF